jgi:predicted nucleic acid-binding protein
VFGAVKQQLKTDGSPIPLNDVWIAAHAIESGSWLVTYDRHFQNVAGILLCNGLTEQGT